MKLARIPLALVLALGLCAGAATVSGCSSDDDTCLTACDRAYDDCIAGGASAGVCATDRDVCKSMCTPTPPSRIDAGR